jgi:hypothetical protein
MFDNLKGVKYLAFRYFTPLRLSSTRGEGRGEGVNLKIFEAL